MNTHSNPSESIEFSPKAHSQFLALPPSTRAKIQSALAKSDLIEYNGPPVPEWRVILAGDQLVFFQHRTTEHPLFVARISCPRSAMLSGLLRAPRFLELLEVIERMGGG